MSARVAVLPHCGRGLLPLFEGDRGGQDQPEDDAEDHPAAADPLSHWGCHPRTCCRMKARITREAIAAPRITVVRGDRSFR